MLQPEQQTCLNNIYMVLKDWANEILFLAIGYVFTRLIISIRSKYYKRRLGKIIERTVIRKGYVTIAFKCELHEYAEYFDYWIGRAKKYIYTTNLFFPSDLFGDSITEKDIIIDHFKKFRDKNLNKEKKRRLQIISKETIEKFKKDPCLQKFLEYNDMNRIWLKWIDPETLQSRYLGDYSIIDGKFILQYDKELRILKEMRGRKLIEEFKMAFSKDCWDRHCRKGIPDC